VAERGEGRRFPLYVGLVGVLLSFIAARWHFPGIGNDAVGYIAIADRFARSGHLGYFLEPKLALWPPGWPVTLGVFRWAFDLSPAITALWINAFCLIGIAYEVNWLLRRTMTNERLIRIGLIIAVLGPATISQSYMVQTETTFGALVLLGMIALIKFSDTRRMSWLLFAAVIQWFAFMDRYVGLVSIGAGALWLCFENGGIKLSGRLRRGVGFFLLASSVPGAWILRNWIVTDSLFGPRDTPVASYKLNAIDAATSLGQYLHGFSKYAPLTGLSRYLSLALAGAVFAFAVVLLRRAMAARDTRPDAWTRPPTGLSDLIGHPVGLMMIYAVAHWAYLIYSASTIAFDPVNTRYLVPMFVPTLIAGFALIDHGAFARSSRADARGDRVTRLASIGIVVLLAGQMAVGVVRVSASYWTNEAQNYNSEAARVVRGSAALDKVPTDCRLYSNFPELMYLAGFETTRTPRIRKFASSDLMHELEDLRSATLAGEKACIIWVFEVEDHFLETQPYTYQLDRLRREFALEPVAEASGVAVYRVTGVK
jgi:hypothetical protein